MRTKVDIADADASRAENLEYTRKNLRGFPIGSGPFTAIRRKCLDCVVWQPSEVAKCEMRDCALWPYRFGGNPWKKGTVRHTKLEQDNG